MATNLVALVTGGNKGLGKQVVRELAKLGMTVILGSRDLGRGETAAAELKAEGLLVEPLAVDVANETSVAAAAVAVEGRHHKRDVLINNAGIHQGRPALEITAVEMRRTYETYVFGLVSMIHSFLPLLKAAPHPRIVNVASTTASHSLTADPNTLFGQDNSVT